MSCVLCGTFKPLQCLLAIFILCYAVFEPFYSARPPATFLLGATPHFEFFTVACRRLCLHFAMQHFKTFTTAGQLRHAQCVDGGEQHKLQIDMCESLVSRPLVWG